MSRLLAVLALLLLASPLAAKCSGQNLLANPDPLIAARVDQALAGQPYASGNFWRLSKGDGVIHLIGTYHLDDPRHDPTMARITPLIAQASTVLVEAGPEEEAALKRAASRDPDLMFITEGPSLLEQLEGPEWDALVAAMEARGIPSIMAAKMKPWYISLMLGMPPCAMAEIANADGLDRQVMALAKAQGVPVRALEPFDTIFTLFAALSPEDQLGMIRSTLPLESRAADFATTLADAYFAQDSRRMWEFMRLSSQDLPDYSAEEVDAEYARMEEVLMTARNRAWIPVIEAAAAEGPTFVAFGALHLSGRAGVLQLLEDAGWQVERLPL